MVQLLFFGRFSDIVENRTLSLPETINTTDDLIAFLSDAIDGFEAAIKRPGTRIAVNKNIIPSATPITDADEIAFMSALSGG